MSRAADTSRSSLAVDLSISSRLRSAFGFDGRTARFSGSIAC
jgi:hypothetical protein